MLRDFDAADGALIQSDASLESVRLNESTDTPVSDGSDDNDPGNPTQPSACLTSSTRSSVVSNPT